VTTYYLQSSPRQMQERMIAEKVHKERSVLLAKMCTACFRNQLRFSRDMAIVAAIMEAIKCSIREVNMGTREHILSMEDLSKRAVDAAMAYKSHPMGANSTVDGHISRLIDGGQVGDVCRNALLLLGKIGSKCQLPADISPMRKYYGDWQWSLLLMRYVTTDCTSYTYYCVSTKLC
jgi:hypothetical protein